MDDFFCSKIKIRTPSLAGCELDQGLSCPWLDLRPPGGRVDAVVPLCRCVFSLSIHTLLISTEPPWYRGTLDNTLHQKLNTRGALCRTAATRNTISELAITYSGKEHVKMDPQTGVIN